MVRVVLCAVFVLVSGLSLSISAAEEHRHIYLLMGQSNMVGRGELTRLPPHPRLLCFNKAGSWIPAVDPLHVTCSRDCVGPGVSFGRGMLHVVDHDWSASVCRWRLAAFTMGVRWREFSGCRAKRMRRTCAGEDYAKRLDAMIFDFRHEIRYA